MGARGDLFTSKEDAALASVVEELRNRAKAAARRLNEELDGFEGIVLRVEDGFRAHAAQDKLYRIGREEIAPGVFSRIKGMDGRFVPRVTDAPPGKSAHQYRRAIHAVLIREKKGWLEPGHPLWRLSRDIAVSEGLVSGFDFKNIFDPAHWELAGWQTIAKARGWKGFEEGEWG